MAAIAISLGQQATSLFTGLWHGHQIRAANARNENQAAAEVVPQWDSFFQAIIAAYNSGEATPEQCLQAFEQMDEQTLQELHQFTGKAGTSWTDYSERISDSAYCRGSHGHCNKQCTVGCCIYYTYLHPAVRCAMSVIASGKSGVVGRGFLHHSKYGFPDMPNWSIKVTPPPPQLTSGVSQVFQSAASVLGLGGGSGQSHIGGAYAQPGALQSAIGPQQDYAKLLLIGGGILVLALLFSRG